MATVDDAVAALREGRAFADLSAWRKVLIRGDDAAGWLNDLVTADLSGLRPGDSSRSLLLSPTGRIRADFTVAALDDGYLLVQDRDQPRPVEALLAPYVLSSDVRIEGRTEDLGLLAFPGARAPTAPEALRYRPSCLGPGEDLAGPDRTALRRAASGRIEAPPDALEAWRIERGAARFGVDLSEDSLPHEAGLDHAIGYGKGCFLGQEAVAKVRNLGHPPFVVMAVRAPVPLSPGDAVTADGTTVGVVTSGVPLRGGDGAGIVRIRWAARAAALRAAGGAALEVAGPASGT